LYPSVKPLGGTRSGTLPRQPRDACATEAGRQICPYAPVHPWCRWVGICGK
jgi:hypothetical protein